MCCSNLPEAESGGGNHIDLAKTLLVMRLTLFFLIAGLLNASARGVSQTITLSGRNLPISKVFAEIRKQTDYLVVSSYELLKQARPVTIHARNEPVELFIREVLKDQPFRYTIENKTISITGKTDPVRSASPEEASPPPPVEVKGRVTDDSDKPVEGATVQVKGANVATTTDANGYYSIAVPDDRSTLVFSHVGFGSREMKVGTNKTINIRLAEASRDLNQIVVIGYGTQKKSDLTGAVSTISAKDVEERQTIKVSEALQGAVPGLAVTRNSGAPGASAAITLRGITTIGNNNPLIIVDGIPTENIDNVNPIDIENISVLKDAASASIYGSRAAAGVILVTTKRARAGESRLDYNYEYGIQKPTILPKYTDAVRYYQLFNEFVTNDGGAPLYSDEFINTYQENHLTNPDLFPNTDWQAAILKDYAPRQMHNLLFTTGSDKVKTKASLGYSSADGLYHNRSYDRYTARINNNLEINKSLSVNLDVAFVRDYYLSPADETGTRNPFLTARVLPPYYKDRYEDGRWAVGKDGINPLAQIFDGGTDKKYYNQLAGRVSLNFRPVKGLSLTALVSPTFDFDRTKSFSKIIEYTDLNDPSRIIDRNQPNTTLTEGRQEAVSLNGQFLANYSITIHNDHHFQGLAGYEEIYNSHDSLSASRGAFEVTSLPYLNVGSLALAGNSGSASESALRSFFGRLQYNYKSKYYVQGNIRRDGSSRFYSDYRWSVFPSLSMGWVLSEESFMKDIRPFTFLKLRGSWGKVGNERIGDYPYQASIVFNNALFYQGSLVTTATTGAQNVYAVKDISWETTESFDIGVDAGVFQNKLTTTLDFYRKMTRGILLNLDIPRYLGYGNPNQNSGTVGAIGWEFETNWRDRAGSLTYSIGFNVSDSKTKIYDLKGTRRISGDNAYIEGGEFNQWFGYKSDGLFQTQEEIDHSAVLNANTKPGDVKYADINGDGKITPEGDKVLLNGSLPRYIYGGNLRLGYKGFDFALVVQGVAKQTSRLSSVQIEPISGGYGNIPTIIEGKFWSPNNTTEQNLNARYPRLSQVSRPNNYQMSDFWLIDGAYFRIKNITIGYNIPSHALGRIKIKALRVYAAANDLFSLNKFPPGWDPEVDATTYPIVKTFMAGLTVQF